jgi:hypothetical protein
MASGRKLAGGAFRRYFSPLITHKKTHKKNVMNSPGSIVTIDQASRFMVNQENKRKRPEPFNQKSEEGKP